VKQQIAPKIWELIRFTLPGVPTEVTIELTLG